MLIIQLSPKHKTPMKAKQTTRLVPRQHVQDGSTHRTLRGPFPSSVPSCKLAKWSTGAEAVVLSNSALAIPSSQTLS